MTHVRTDIREDILTALNAVFTSRVRASHAYILNSEKSYPTTFVYTVAERSQKPVINSNTQMRNLSVSIEHHITGVNADGLDDALDVASVTIEKAMAATDFTPVKVVFLSGTEVAFEADGKFPIGMLRLTYEFEYFTDVDDPEIGR